MPPPPCLPPPPSCARAAFTLTEVLIAAALVAFGLMALGGMVSAVVSKGKTPNLVEQAALLASERLQAFRGHDGGRSQGLFVSSLTAVGGSYYPEPVGTKVFRPNEWAGRHNLSNAWSNSALPAAPLWNKTPLLFVREFLFDPSEVQLAQAADHQEGSRLRAKGQSDDTRSAAASFAGQALSVGPNEVPKLPAAFGGVPVRLVCPNRGPLPDATGGWPDGTTVGPATAQQVTDAGGSFWRVPMPRTNPQVPGPDLANNLNHPRLRFVREVWIQLNHPKRGELDPGQGPYAPPPALGAQLVSWPPFQAAPPYSVVVTVRVFRKEPTVRHYQVAPPFGPEDGPGYRLGVAPLASISAVVSQPE